jgi:hypothetical protein
MRASVFMDLHTTNGSIHGYAPTYAPALTLTLTASAARAAARW